MPHEHLHILGVRHNAHMRRISLVLVALLLPSFVGAAAIDHIAFTTDVQSVAPSTVSAQITIEAQDAAGVAVNGNSVCMQVTSSSASGEFSTNESSWPATPTSALSLTLSTSQFRRNFYYRDASSGTVTLTVKAALRPGSTCTGWDPAGATWTATQLITIGSGSSSNQNTNSQTSTSTTASSQSSNSTIVSSYVAPPVAAVFADGGENCMVIVGADTEFRGRAYNRDQEIVDNVRFNWNFGDGTVADGSSVLHNFSYPGTYVVVLTIAQHISAASDRILVTAEPAELHFSVNADGSISIGNEAGRDIDISRWLVRSFGRSFVFPDGTVILEGETLRIPNSTLGFTVGPQTELQYPNGMRAELLSAAPAAFAPAPSVAVTVAPPAVTRTFVPSTVSRVDEEARPQEVATTTSIVASSSLAAAGSVDTGSYLWWLAAFALSLAACGAVYAIKHAKKGEWNIIDESR